MTVLTSGKAPALSVRLGPQGLPLYSTVRLLCDGRFRILFPLCFVSSLEVGIEAFSSLWLQHRAQGVMQSRPQYGPAE